MCFSKLLSTQIVRNFKSSTQIVRLPQLITRYLQGQKHYFFCAFALAGVDRACNLPRALPCAMSLLAFQAVVGYKRIIGRWYWFRRVLRFTEIRFPFFLCDKKESVCICAICGFIKTHRTSVLDCSDYSDGQIIITEKNKGQRTRFTLHVKRCTLSFVLCT